MNAIDAIFAEMDTLEPAEQSNVLHRLAETYGGDDRETQLEQKIAKLESEISRLNSAIHSRNARRVAARRLNRSERLVIVAAMHWHRKRTIGKLGLMQACVNLEKLKKK